MYIISFQSIAMIHSIMCMYIQQLILQSHMKINITYYDGLREKKKVKLKIVAARITLAHHSIELLKKTEMERKIKVKFLPWLRSC